MEFSNAFLVEICYRLPCNNSYALSQFQWSQPPATKHAPGPSPNFKESPQLS